MPKINNAALARGENIWKAMTDEEIVEALAGRKIWWRSTVTGKLDSARLLAHDARQTKVTRYTKGRGTGARKIRCIEFVSQGVNGAFRAVRLRNIVKVGK